MPDALLNDSFDLVNMNDKMEKSSLSTLLDKTMFGLNLEDYDLIIFDDNQNIYPLAAKLSGKLGCELIPHVNRVDLESTTLSFEFNIYGTNEHVDIDYKMNPTIICINTRTPQISKCKIIFCIGRGASSDEIIKKIKKLSSVYNAQIYGTRVAKFMGIVDDSHQIGKSGVKVEPALYVGFGVSGAIQHTVGISHKTKIVDINKERTRLFELADYTFITDVNKLVDDLIELNK